MKTLDEDVTDGLAYGYPACCILAFLNRGGTANKSQALAYGVRDRLNPHVPCGIFHKADFWPPAWEYRGYTLESYV